MKNIQKTNKIGGDLKLRGDIFPPKGPEKITVYVKCSSNSSTLCRADKLLRRAVALSRAQATGRIENSNFLLPPFLSKIQQHKSLHSAIMHSICA